MAISEDLPEPRAADDGGVTARLDVEVDAVDGQDLAALGDVAFAQGPA